MLLVFSILFFQAVSSTVGSPLKDGNRTAENVQQLANIEIGQPRAVVNGDTSAGSGPLELLAAGITDTRMRLLQNQMDLMQHRMQQQEMMTATMRSNSGNDQMDDWLRRLELNITRILKRNQRTQRYFSSHQIVVGNATMDLPVDPASESSDPSNDDDIILMQQHFGGSTFFDKPWVEYRDGFGHVTGNYWLGNDRIHEVTKDGGYKLRVDLLARANNRWYWAEYSVFRVHDASMGYVLNVGGYRGTAGDAMADANGSKFTTKDADNDVWSDNCAAHAHIGNGAGFWYRNCGQVFVNSPLNAHNGFKWHKLPTGSDMSLMYSRLTLMRQ